MMTRTLGPEVLRHDRNGVEPVHPLNPLTAFLSICKREEMSTPLGDLGNGGKMPEEYQHLDLDVRNYTLQELLDLLKLPQGFTGCSTRPT
jgi:hypothetical protein